ncbi:ATP synthase subunit s, mitochondrial-like [Dendronephthya gigantea]|uniref:ATP synthase subunit s, mitochondrial-like n=1 Tax=Dendronephthya gigantea TaxID=151771 RepID=UPI00106D24DC|nr:ATP synthase subunit s, mitochondrial-like [Dendronephthya gigantea]
MLHTFQILNNLKPAKLSRRGFYLWLNNIFNRVDEDRRKTVGPERIAGEWILRCGGGVKFTRVDRYIWDYNALPEWSKNKYEVEGIDAKNTYITDGGLDHLVGLEHLKSLNLHNCRYVTDLTKLLPVKESLQELDISNCIQITDLSSLFKLRYLRFLSMSGMLSVKDQNSTIKRLKEVLPGCEINH